MKPEERLRVPDSITADLREDKTPKGQLEGKKEKKQNHKANLSPRYFPFRQGISRVKIVKILVNLALRFCLFAFFERFRNLIFS